MRTLRFLAAALVWVGVLSPAWAQIGEVPHDQPRPVLVGVSARVLDVTRIQENTGEMAANVEVTLKWADNRNAFDPVKQGMVRKVFHGRAAAQELEKLWHPAAVFRNVVGAPRSDEYGLIIDFSGDVTLVRNIDANFRFRIDMSRFPFDTVDLPIEITSARYPSSQVGFTHFSRDNVNSTLNKTPRASSWLLIGMEFHESSAIAWNGESRSVMNIMIEGSQRAGPIFFRIFVPFFMIMMSSLFVLWLPDTNYFGKGTMIFSALVALVALSFTLESNFPGSISLQTPVSSILTSGFVFLVSALILNIVVMNPEAAWAKRHSFVAREVRSVIKWSVPALMVLIWGTLVLRALV